jgi:atypical dual specificity phosphatase
MQADSEPPSRSSDGFLDCVCAVRSRDAADRLAATLSDTLLSNKIPNIDRERLHKFPRTRHLVNLGAASSDDQVLTPDEALAFWNTGDKGAEKIVVQEKVDGANVGLSIDPETLRVRVQNRAHFVTSETHAQFRKLDAWIERHSPSLWHVLTEHGGAVPPGRRILFGEWMCVKHSIHYTALTDVFLAFDMYDVQSNTFSSTEALRRALRDTDIKMVPILNTWNEKSSFQDLVRNVREGNVPSAFSEEGQQISAEGVYVRKETCDRVLNRAKIVRPGFVQSEDHWTKARTVYNNIKQPHPI